MTPKRRSRSATRLPLLLIVILVLASTASAEWKEKVLYSFQGGTSNGSVPAGGVVFDSAGNLYGATTGGGPDSCAPIGNECGTVFQLAPPAKKGDPWTETILYQFKGEGSQDGSAPAGGVILDAAGNIYGTTAYGGTGDCIQLGVKAGCGTVYELSPPKQKGGPWTERLRYSFKGGNDGYFPSGTLTFDSKGNLYGATQFGGGKGTTCNSIFQYCGTVFELRPAKQKGGQWTEKVLHSFAGGKDGANPNGGVVLDAQGRVYGTAYSGGNQGCGTSHSVGCGTIFRLVRQANQDTSWTEEQLHVFSGDHDGGLPYAGVVFDKDRDLYGSASGGGINAQGTIFCLRRPTGKKRLWQLITLHEFSGGNDGQNPVGGVVLDFHSKLYGTAEYALDTSGDVFEMMPRQGGTWEFILLYGFTGSSNGAQPASNLVFDSKGTLYGTTQNGGTGTNCGFAGCGTVYEVSP